MTEPTELQEWRPDWARHVVGRYEPRRYEDGQPLPQKVVMHCETCGADWQAECPSGNVRRHIQNFAHAHAHRDPLAAPTVVRPGSRRSTIKE